MKYLIIFLLGIATAKADLILLTPGQKLHQQVSILTTALWNGLANGDKNLFNLIWHNPDKVNLQPCDALRSLLTDAASARASHAAVSQFMNALVPGSNTLVEDPSYTIVNNQDGSVTCTPPVAPSPSPSPSASPSP